MAQHSAVHNTVKPTWHAHDAQTIHERMVFWTAQFCSRVSVGADAKPHAYCRMSPGHPKCTLTS